MSHDPERTQELSEVRQSKTAGELMQFLQAINWMRTFLPEPAELEAPLHGLLEECLVQYTAHQTRGGGVSDSPKARIVCGDLP